MKLYNVILRPVNTAQVSNLLATGVNYIIVSTPLIGLPDLLRQAENSSKE